MPLDPSFWMEPEPEPEQPTSKVWGTDPRAIVGFWSDRPGLPKVILDEIRRGATSLAEQFDAQFLMKMKIRREPSDAP